MFSFDEWIDRATLAAPGSRSARLVAFCRRITTHVAFERTVIGLIVANAALLGLQTSPDFMARWGGLAHVLDALFILAFVAEIAMRLIAQGRAFFRSGWAWFDLIVVLISIVPTTEGMSVLRAFRVLRVLRLISVSPKMRRVIGGFFAAMPGMVGVIGVLAVIFYVSAVITTTAFGQVDPGAPPPGASIGDVIMVRQLFGSLDRSFFTLFQLMTLEDWSAGIVKPTLAVHPDALWFFVPYIVLTSFAVLNLFIGIIVDAMQDERDEAVAEARLLGKARGEIDPARADAEALVALTAEVRALRAEVRALREPRAPT